VLKGPIPNGRPDVLVQFSRLKSTLRASRSKLDQLPPQPRTRSKRPPATAQAADIPNGRFGRSGLGAFARLWLSPGRMNLRPGLTPKYSSPKTINFRDLVLTVRIFIGALVITGIVGKDAHQ
jgi:hypothetical protein